MKKMLLACGIFLTVLFLGSVACIQTPREINVDASGWRRERVDTSATYDAKSNDQLRRVQAENERLREENARLKKKNEELNKKLHD